MRTGLEKEFVRRQILQPLPFLGDLCGIVIGKLAESSRLKSSPHGVFGDLLHHLTVTGKLRPILSTQQLDLVACNPVRLPINDQPLARNWIEEGKIDDAFQTTVVAHLPEERHFGANHRALILPADHEIGNGVDLLAQKSPFACRTRSIW